MNWKIYLTAAAALLLLIQCEAKPSRRRRSAPVFHEDGNLSFKDCGVGNPSAKNIDEQSPWLVRILLKGRITPTKCFGVIISNDTVLTTAFCIENDRRNVQLPQKVLLVNHFTSEDGHQTVRKIIHDEYDLIEMDNNIALLKFDHDLLQSGARPICLWNQEMESNNNYGVAINAGVGTVIGMGRGNANFNLSKAEVQTNGPEECKKLISKRHHKVFEKEHLCATLKETSQGGCLGGFGAPLQFKIGDRWYLRGLYDSSFKALDKTHTCSKSYVISFTDTARHVKFITQNAGIELKNSLIVNDARFKGLYSYSNCGKVFSAARTSSTVLSLGGKPTDIREVPWTAALYTYTNQAHKFLCGGTLISSRYILSAAHCVYVDRSRVMPAEELIIFLGKTSFLGDMTSDEGVNSKQVQKIMPYESYNPMTNEHDIALIELKYPIQMSETIATVCLWSGSSEETFIVGKTGVMSGWGFVNYSKEHAKGLQALELPIIAKERCKSIIVTHSTGYYGLKTQWQTLCAGYINENKGPCNGDSGGPLVMKRDGRYYLRGIVSESVSHATDPSLCNANYPAIFTDVALYRAWIKHKTAHELLNFDTSSKFF